MARLIHEYINSELMPEDKISWIGGHWHVIHPHQRVSKVCDF